MTFVSYRRRRMAGPYSAMVGLALAGCAHEPAGPTVTVLPAKGESFALFQQHDSTCRQYASAQTGQSPGQAGLRRGLAGAIVGTGLGAATGALFGSVSGNAGSGAAIGGGAGLLAGTLLGSAGGRTAAASVQNRYNISYTQCMAANGEQVPQPVVPAPVAYAAVLASAVYVPAPVYAVPPPPVPMARAPGS